MNNETVKIPEDFFFVDLNHHQPPLEPLKYGEICRVLVNNVGVVAHTNALKHGILIMRLAGKASTSLAGVEVFTSGTPEFDHWLKLAFIEQVMK